MKDANGKWIGYGLGDTGPQVLRIQHRLLAAYPKNSQAKTLGVVESGIYDQATTDAVRNIQPFLNLPATGVADFATQRALGAVDAPVPAPTPVHRKIWIYSAPGSGGTWNQGPSFDLGNRCSDVLHLNHQPISFQMGGYLGLMGGDPTFSYDDVIYDQYQSLLWLLDHNPDIDDPDLELWLSGYSQSADGMEDALEILFGDGGFVIPKTGETVGPGKYRHLRDRINGVVQFGNPSKKDTGIARKVRPAWLDAKIQNVFYDNDFYAMVPTSDKIRPAFYAIIVEANMALPFFVHVLRIAVPIILKWAATLLPMFGPLLGGFGPLVQLALSTIGGLQTLGNNAAFAGLMGMAGSDADTKVDEDLENLLEPTGLLENIPGLIGLVGALPGLQAHGNYPFDPVKMDEAYAHIASFRR